MLKGHKSKKKMLTLVFLIINHEMFAFATRRKNGWQSKLKSPLVSLKCRSHLHSVRDASPEP